MRLHRVHSILLAATLLSALPDISFAQNTQTAALTNQALDKPVNLDLNTTLPEAMRTIGKATGVRIEATQSVWDALPWGDQTNITAKTQNSTLRDAMAAITQKLGLRFTLKDEAVELSPVPALLRLGRRATMQELQAVDLLASTPAALGSERLSVRQLIDAIDQKLVDSKKDFAIESRPGDNVVQDQVLFIPRNDTLLDALEVLPASTRATWYPWGKSIVIVSKEDQLRNQLSKTITVRYPGTDVMQVLTELSQKANVEFEIEPGAIQRIPPDARRIKLDLYDASITKALEAIVGFTGLGYVVSDKGVYIWNAANNAVATTREPSVGLIQLDDGMQVLVPAADIPSDLRDYIKAQTQKQLAKLRQRMNAEGFKSSAPATQPATKPSEDL